MFAPAPTPIGLGPAFHPRPAVHAACTRAPLETGERVHVELFAKGRVVIIPAAVGVGGARITLGRVQAARCRAHVWTLDPTGVVQFQGPTRLGDLFRVWGRLLSPERLLSFPGAVRMYRNGARRFGDPGTLVLRDRDEIVLEVGPYIAPHHTYLFPSH